MGDGCRLNSLGPLLGRKVSGSAFAILTARGWTRNASCIAWLVPSRLPSESLSQAASVTSLHPCPHPSFR